MINGWGENGRDSAMWSVTLQALRTCTMCEGCTFLAWPSLLLDNQSCLGFQLGLNEAQFEILDDSMSFAPIVGPKYKA